MSKCPNCDIKLGCSCKKRTAKNGTNGCTSCIASLNAESSQIEEPKYTIATTGPIVSAKIRKRFPEGYEYTDEQSTYDK